MSEDKTRIRLSINTIDVRNLGLTRLFMAEIAANRPPGRLAMMLMTEGLQSFERQNIDVATLLGSGLDAAPKADIASPPPRRRGRPPRRAGTDTLPPSKIDLPPEQPHAKTADVRPEQKNSRGSAPEEASSTRSDSTPATEQDSQLRDFLSAFAYDDE